jgi:hypothetical protein
MTSLLSGLEAEGVFVVAGGAAVVVGEGGGEVEERRARAIVRVCVVRALKMGTTFMRMGRTMMMSGKWRSLMGLGILMAMLTWSSTRIQMKPRVTKGKVARGEVKVNEPQSRKERGDSVVVVADR